MLKVSTFAETSGMMRTLPAAPARIPPYRADVAGFFVRPTA
jgi:hypothetical protein